jgi:hypothetical protein
MKPGPRSLVAAIGFVALGGLLIRMPTPVAGQQPRRNQPSAPAQGRGQGDGMVRIEQQTAYQVDPIEIRLQGKEGFEIHRLELTATVPAYSADAGRARDQSVGKQPIRPNGKLTLYGRGKRFDAH